MRGNGVSVLKPGTAVQSIWKVEAGASGVRVHPQLHRELRSYINQ